MSDYTLKRCTKCGEEKPATAEYFHRDKSLKSGLYSRCKQCRIEQIRQYRRQNCERKAEYDRQYYISNCERIKERSRRQFQANPEYARQYRLVNSEHRAGLGRQHRKDKPHLYRAAKLRRRARQQELPGELTVSDWQRCLEYFNGCCAVCGRQLKDLFSTHTAAADHWIALNDARKDNPGTVPTNIVPLCHGLDGCNNSKHDSDPIIWLNQRYSTHKAKKILRRVADYFTWIKEQDKPD